MRRRCLGEDASKAMEVRADGDLARELFDEGQISGWTPADTAATIEHEAAGGKKAMLEPAKECSAGAAMHMTLDREDCAGHGGAEVLSGELQYSTSSSVVTVMGIR